MLSHMGLLHRERKNKQKFLLYDSGLTQFHSCLLLVLALEVINLLVDLGLDTLA
jgi:hypothetical protein